MLRNTLTQKRTRTYGVQGRTGGPNGHGAEGGNPIREGVQGRTRAYRGSKGSRGGGGEPHRKEEEQEEQEQEEGGGARKSRTFTRG